MRELPLSNLLQIHLYLKKACELFFALGFRSTAHVGTAQAVHHTRWLLLPHQNLGCRRCRTYSMLLLCAVQQMTCARA